MSCNCKHWNCYHEVKKKTADESVWWRKPLEIDMSLSSKVHPSSLFCEIIMNFADILLRSASHTSVLMRGCVFAFSGQDGEYGLESEEVFLTPEDENPLRRILQVHSLNVSPLPIFSTYKCTRSATHKPRKKKKSEHAHSATLHDLGWRNNVRLIFTRGKNISTTHTQKNRDWKLTKIQQNGLSPGAYRFFIFCFQYFLTTMLCICNVTIKSKCSSNIFCWKK